MKPLRVSFQHGRVAGLSAEIGYFLVSVALIFLLIAFITGQARLPGP
ncbi:MAG: hypothetical protein HY271_00935 [Deltaproteobacteria bacterium]|nr:hypothetical protein [Deltaproteobacteria bacterium]